MADQSYSGHKICVLCGLDGERGRNRTYNLLIKSQLLCQLSYAPTVGMWLVGRTKIIASSGRFSQEEAQRDSSALSFSSGQIGTQRGCRRRPFMKASAASAATIIEPSRNTISWTRRLTSSLPFCFKFAKHQRSGLSVLIV